MEFTKQHALDLWIKFLDCNKVKNRIEPYGSGYCQYVLSLEKKGKKESQIILITFDLRIVPKELNQIRENHMKDLITPYGTFALTVEEANRCRDLFSIYVDNQKLTYNELLVELGHTPLS